MRVSKTGLETAIFGKTADVAILKEALSNAALSDEEEFDWTLLFLIVIFAMNFFVILLIKMHLLNLWGVTTLFYQL